MEDDGWGDPYGDEVDPMAEVIAQIELEMSIKAKMESKKIRFQPSRRVEN